MRRVTAFAPGRVNLIGEHTDYNGGLCLPFATGRGLTVTAEPLDRGEVEVLARDLGEHDRFSLDAIGRVPGWRAYVHGIASELVSAGHSLCGARLEVRSELPAGGGLASSAALTIAAALALLRVAGQPAPEPVSLARLCSRVENEWAGAETGLLDQLAILCARPGHATRIDTITASVETVPLALGEWKLQLLDSGVRHAHADGGYNERRGECRRACALLGIDSLRHAAPDDVERLPPPLGRRLRHVLSENARVERMVGALRRSDVAEVGALLDEGHASLRDDYAVSVPAVEEAVARVKASGAAGARMLGGGFGGHVLGLFPPGASAPEDTLPVSAGGGVQVM
jgi:galactokinase